MKLNVLNDLHIGAIRTSGTTPASAADLRKYILSSFEGLLNTIDGALLLNGDVFDTYSVPLTDLLGCYNLLADWLNRTDAVLFSNCGNHDISKDSSKLSSLQFLNALLLENFGPERVVIVDQPTMTPHGYIVPHLLNQDIFDLALSNVPPCSVVYLHCNVNNNFATQADHSLNITLEQLAALPCDYVVCAHEHHMRKVGKVTLPGNQIPTSISDCLNTKAKYYAVVENGVPELKQLSTIDAWYGELDWQNITASSAKFIRITGTATPEQAADVASRISELRRSSDAFVISNAVQIGSMDSEQASQSLESVKAFDVMGALRLILDEDEMTILGALK